eukprot:5092089-Ditylum_brightwellii.AAC.1
MPSNTTVAYLSPCKNPLYANINIDFNLLSQLPKDGSVKSEVNVIEEEEFGQNAENISAAARETN